MNESILLPVGHSQRLREAPLKVWILVDGEGSICTAHCTCMAGSGEAISVQHFLQWRQQCASESQRRVHKRQMFGYPHIALARSTRDSKTLALRHRRKRKAAWMPFPRGRLTNSNKSVHRHQFCHLERLKAYNILF